MKSKLMIPVLLFSSLSQAQVPEFVSNFVTQWDSRVSTASSKLNQLKTQQSGLRSKIMQSANATCVAVDSVTASKCAKINRENADSLEKFGSDLKKMDEEIKVASAQYDAEKNKVWEEYAKTAEDKKDSLVNSVKQKSTDTKNAVVDTAAAASKSVTDTALNAKKAVVQSFQMARQQAVLDKAFTDLRLQVSDMRSDSMEMKSQVQVLENEIDKTRLSLYLQEKMAKLLNSEVFCSAQKQCGGTRNVKRSDLAEIFTSLKTEGAAIQPASTNSANSVK